MKTRLSYHLSEANGDKEIFKIDDYVYYETSPSEPYSVGKITEFKKNGDGEKTETVVKMTVFVRRNSSPRSVKELAESNEKEFCRDFGLTYEPEILAEDLKLLSFQRELFLTKDIIIIPLTSLRGKCSVFGLSEVDSRRDIVSKNDTFYYSSLYNRSSSPVVKFPDRGEIRVGQRYQAEIPPIPKDGEKYSRDSKELEECVFKPNQITEEEIDKFCEAFIERNMSLRIKSGDPLYQVSETCSLYSKRDITIQGAMDFLAKRDFNLDQAMCDLYDHSDDEVTVKAPLDEIFRKDLLESWGQLNRVIFEKLLKTNKDFEKMKTFVGNTDTKQLVEYYYLWKVTKNAKIYRENNFNCGKKKLKIVSFNCQSRVLTNGVSSPFPHSCENCKSKISMIFEITPKKLCVHCYTYWKKLMAFPTEKQYNSRNTKTSALTRTGASNGVPKGRTPFFYQATKSMRDARFRCQDILNLKRAAKVPFEPINARLFLNSVAERENRPVPKSKPILNKKIQDNKNLKISFTSIPSWLSQNGDSRHAAKRGNDATDSSNSVQTNGTKRRRLAPPSILGKSVPDYENISRNAVAASYGLRAKVSTYTNVDGESQQINYVDAPDDVYYVATEQEKQMRKQLTARQLRHCARNPNKPIILESNEATVNNAAAVQQHLASLAEAQKRASSKASSASSSMASNLSALVSQVASNSSAAAAVNSLAAFSAANFANFPGFSGLPAQLAQMPAHSQAALQQLLQRQLFQNNTPNNHFPNGFMNFSHNGGGRAFNGSGSSSGKHPK